MKPGAQKQKKGTLPEEVALFPLPGALLLPNGQLPLNIFEPRYLRMVDDVLGGSRMIGMIQPRAPGAGGQEPLLYGVGCAGRITSFSETGDGRYLITLTGLHRFQLIDELDTPAPYRTAKADWSPFAIDVHEDTSGETIDRDHFIEVMQEYLDAENLKTDWDAVDDAPLEALVVSLAMGCPFAPNEKQALLETRTVAERAECLIALMEMAGGDETGGAPLQ